MLEMFSHMEKVALTTLRNASFLHVLSAVTWDTCRVVRLSRVFSQLKKKPVIKHRFKEVKILYFSKK